MTPTASGESVFAVRPHVDAEPVYFPDWFVWRWGQRFPEDVAVMTSYRVHGEVIGSRIPHEHEHAVREGETA